MRCVDVATSDASGEGALPQASELTRKGVPRTRKRRTLPIARRSQGPARAWPAGASPGRRSQRMPRPRVPLAHVAPIPPPPTAGAALAISRERSTPRRALTGGVDRPPIDATARPARWRGLAADSATPPPSTPWFAGVFGLGTVGMGFAVCVGMVCQRPRLGVVDRASSLWRLSSHHAVRSAGVRAVRSAWVGSAWVRAVRSAEVGAVGSAWVGAVRWAWVGSAWVGVVGAVRSAWIGSACRTRADRPPGVRAGARCRRPRPCCPARGPPL